MKPSFAILADGHIDNAGHYGANYEADANRGHGTAVRKRALVHEELREDGNHDRQIEADKRKFHRGVNT